DGRARLSDLVFRVRRFELHPVHASLRLVGLQPRYAIVETAVRGVARIALCHYDEIGIELVFHVDRGAVACDRLLDGHHFDARALRRSLPFDGLAGDGDARDARAYAFANHAPHRHDPTVAGVAVHDDRKLDAVRDPARDLNALRHRRRAHVRKAGVRADDTA